MTTNLTERQVSIYEYESRQLIAVRFWRGEVPTIHDDICLVEHRNRYTLRVVDRLWWPDHSSLKNTTELIPINLYCSITNQTAVAP